MRWSPLLLLVACLPAEDDKVWTGDSGDSVVPTHTDADTDTDADACPTYPPPVALAASTPSPGATFTLQQLRTEGAACAVVDDVDLDGHRDLVLVEQFGNQLRVEKYAGNGTRSPVLTTSLLGATEGTESGGCTSLDVDDDHDLDILLLTSHGVRLLRHDPDGYTDGGEVATVDAAVADPARTPELLALIDLDHTPPLDLVVGHHAILSDTCPDPTTLDTGDVIVAPPQMVPATLSCFVGQSGGTWVAAPEGVCPSPMLAHDAVAPYGAEVGDFDHDGDADMMLVADFSYNRLFEGTPTGLVPHDGVGVDVYNHGMGVASDDFDGDGQHDVYVTDLGPTSLYLGQCGVWFDGSRSLGLWKTTHQTVTWGTQAVDVDANGAPDLVVGVSVDAAGSSDPAGMCIGPDGAATPHPDTLLLMNPGDGRFLRYGITDTTAPPLHATGRPVRVAVGDLDGDLAPDLVVATGAATSILWNDVQQQGPVLRVRPVDAAGRPAVGARVVIDQGTFHRYRDLWPASGKSGVSEPVAAFAFAGGGEATVRVRWPDGTWTTHGPYPPTSTEVAVQP